MRFTDKIKNKEVAYKNTLKIDTKGRVQLNREGLAAVGLNPGDAITVTYVVQNEESFIIVKKKGE